VGLRRAPDGQPPLQHNTTDSVVCCAVFSAASGALNGPDGAPNLSALLSNPMFLNFAETVRSPLRIKHCDCQCDVQWHSVRRTRAHGHAGVLSASLSPLGTDGLCSGWAVSVVGRHCLFPTRLLWVALWLMAC
jgi:hypothetical protein